MIKVTELLSQIKNINTANKYDLAVKQYGYVFYQLLGIDTLRYFWIHDIKFIIDFDKKLYYILSNSDELETLGESFSEFDYNLLINFYNSYSTNSLESINGIYNIIKSLIK